MIERFVEMLMHNMYAPAMFALGMLCLVIAAISYGMQDNRAAKAFTALAMMFGGIFVWQQPEPTGTVGMVVTIVSILALLYFGVRGWHTDRVPHSRA